MVVTILISIILFVTIEKPFQEVGNMIASTFFFKKPRVISTAVKADDDSKNK
jgi:peptidoglycan/LPS O-acetylase OafA/YrhL